MIKKIICLLALCGGIQAADTNTWVETYFSNRLATAVGTNQIDEMTIYASDRWPLAISEIKGGDRIIVILSGPLYKQPADTNIYSINWVGYIRMDIPTTNSPPTLKLVSSKK